MSAPINPETIIIKNKYYPKGLREIDLWNYYQKVKGSILKETQNRNIMFAVMVKPNKPIIRRKGKSGILRLTPKNYDTMITGRTTTVYSEMSGYENFGILDIDIHPSDGFAWAKKATADVYDFVMEKMPIVRAASIRFTGKSSFHIVCHFGRKLKIDPMRFLLEKFLRESPLARVYQVSGKRTSGIPNIDLSPNKYRGTYITLYSLSILGLKCMTVNYAELSTFNPNRARIK